MSANRTRRSSKMNLFLERTAINLLSLVLKKKESSFQMERNPKKLKIIWKLNQKYQSTQSQIYLKAKEKVESFSSIVTGIQ